MNHDNNALIRKMAAGQWILASENQKNVVRIGMIPKEMADEQFEVLGKLDDHYRLLALALFDCADADGGMRA